jgi:hypothetical protein
MSTTHINEPTEKSEKQVAIQLGGEVLLRDYFAAKAMQVLMAETDGVGDDNPGAPSWLSHQVAELAYEQADAMLKARDA